MNITIDELIEIFQREKKTIDEYDFTQLNEIIAAEVNNVVQSEISRFRTVYSYIKLNCLDQASHYLFQGLEINQFGKNIYYAKNGRIVPNVFTPGYTYIPPDSDPGPDGDCNECCDCLCDCDYPIRSIIATLVVVGAGFLVVCNFQAICECCCNCIGSAAEGLLELVCNECLGC